MAETLIMRLSSLREIRVPPTNVVRKYSGLEQDAVAAGRELQVESVLDGHIQKADDRLRVTVITSPPVSASIAGDRASVAG